jgi:branched-chain amino acid transport system permease protein
MDSSLIIELAINGALIGLMYALVALGIVLIYKTSVSQTSPRGRSP